MSLVLYFVALLACGTFGLPTTIPFLGINQAGSLNFQSTYQKEGQLITGVSQITSFSFWIAQASSNSQSGEASVGLWSSSGVTVIKTVAVTFPTTLSSQYVQVTANLALSGLDPRQTYVIYFTSSASSISASAIRQFALAQLTGGNGGQGAVSYYGPTSSLIGVNYWTTTSFDYRFALVSDNTISLPNTNYATGPGANSLAWSCNYKTSFYQIQVNWQTMLVNTAFVGNSLSQLIASSGQCQSAVFVPYGTASSCSPTTIQSAAVIDLSNTILKVSDTFSPVGYYPSGSAVASNNGQTYTLSVAGYCGMEVTSESKAAGCNGYPNMCSGGNYLMVAYV